MPKYITTSSSYFEPFTYDQLAAPIREMAEMHRATQDTYDQINLEAESLRNYLEREPDDSNARRMYDSYMNKLSTLQNNLWSNGYNAQTRRDLTAARNGYASDILRLGKAIETRQQRSAEYNKYRLEHPDAVMSSDPGLASLDEYLSNDLYGQDYFATSGDKLANDIASDLQARGKELASDPKLMDMNLPGYYFLKTNNGFTNKQVNDAFNAVQSYWNGDGGKAMDGLDTITKIAADAIKYHIDKTGASSAVTRNEFDKLLGYAQYGASHGVGEPKVEHLQNLQWQYDMQDRNAARTSQRALDNWKAQHRLEHPELYDANGNRIVPKTNEPAYVVPSFYVNQQGADADKIAKQISKRHNKIDADNPISITFADGTSRTFTDSDELNEAVRNTRGSRFLRERMGLNVTDKPAKRKKDQVVHSVYSVDNNGNNVKLDFILSYPTDEELEKYPLYKKDTIVLRRVDENGNPGAIEEGLTSFYMENMEAHNSEVQQTLKRSGIDDLDDYTLSSRDESRIRKDMNVPSTVDTKYLRTIEELSTNTREIKVPPIVDARNEAMLRDYALTIVNSYYANSHGPKNRRYPIYKVNEDGRTYNKKNPLKLDNVIAMDADTHEINGSGGITSISATPEDAINHMIRVVVAGKGTYVMDAHLVDDITGGNVDMLSELLPELYRPFSDPVGMFSESDSGSSETLYKNLYNMNPMYVSDIEDISDIYNQTMKDVMNDPTSRGEYYGLITKLIAESFIPDYETHAYRNPQHRGDTKAEPQSALTE